MLGGGQSQRATCDADCTSLEHRVAGVIQVASRRPLPLGWSNQCRSVGYGALTTHRRAPEIGAKQGAPMPRTAVRTGVHDITRGAGDHGRALHPPMGVQQPSERRPDSAGLPASPKLGRAPLAPEASPSIGVRAPDGERSTAPVVSAPRQFTHSGDAASRRAAQGAVDGATRSHAAPFPRSTPVGWAQDLGVRSPGGSTLRHAESRANPPEGARLVLRGRSELTLRRYLVLSADRLLSRAAADSES